jgi:predicted outer membrane repeat protein
MDFKNAYLFIILVVFGINCQSQTIISGGYVSGSWDSSGSPYLVQETITVHEDSSLFILPGVTVAFRDSAYFNIVGYFAASGSITDSIHFNSSESTWLGIRINHNDSVYIDNTIFNYCTFTNAYSSPMFVNGGALSIKDRDDISMFNCTFRNNFTKNRGGAIYLDNSNTMIKNTSFELNTTGIVLESSKGGAIYALNSEPTLENCLFQYNESVVAGALYCNNSSIDIDRSIFQNNMSLAGGGAFVAHHSGVFSIDDCIFQNNYANGSGGAIALLEGVWARFRDCTIVDNISQSELYLADGGGVLIPPYDNKVIFINCNISNNKAGDYGGGVYATSPSQFISCLFNSNSAALDMTGPGGGGAITMSLGGYQILNSTFSGNTGGEGTTILCEDADFYLINSIIWDDTIGTDSKIYLSMVEETPHLHISNCDIEGGQQVIRGSGFYVLDWASGNIDENPLFEILGIDFSLSNESPCIDTGRTDTLQLLIPSNDIAGNPRIFRDEIDIGCYENQFPFGIYETSLEPDFLVYPNPARELFYIRSENENFEGKLLLTDISGRKILEKMINISSGGIIKQSITAVPPGIYILNLISKRQSYTRKLLIQ